MHITKQHLQSINKSNHLVLNSCDIQFNVLEDNDNGENDHSNTADIAKHLEHYLKDIISISKKTIFGSSDFNYSICTDSDGSNIGWIDIYSDEERGVDIRCLLKIPFMNNIGCEDNSERNNIAASSITATMKIICSINEKFDIRFICE